jgi:predicted RecA/RadA family phage recombinase
MAANYKYTGKRLKVVAAAARTSGAVVADVLAAGGSKQVAGVALSTCSTGDTYTIAVGGVYNVTVPASCAAGTLLYAPGNTGGPTAGNVTLTATSTSNTLFGKTLTSADVSNKADVLILEPRY